MSDPGDRVLDRLREMFGIEATDVNAVFDALERYDRANLRTISKQHADLGTFIDANEGLGAEVVSLREALATAEAACNTVTAYRTAIVDAEARASIDAALAAWRSSRPVDPQQPRVSGTADVSDQPDMVDHERFCAWLDRLSDEAFEAWLKQRHRVRNGQESKRLDGTVES